MRFFGDLERLVLCLEPDCQKVYELTFPACPACTSNQSVPLTKWVPSMRAIVRIREERRAA